MQEKIRAKLMPDHGFQLIIMTLKLSSVFAVNRVSAYLAF